MPIDYKEYHPKWTLIVRLVLKRDHHRCKFCGLQNKKIIIRQRAGEKWYRDLNYQEWSWYSEYHHRGYAERMVLRILRATRIVLTIAHLDGNKDNNRFLNLAALCQRCHLRHDLHHHIANRKYGRKHTRKHQLRLFPI